MSRDENQNRLFHAITQKPQDCLDCELAVVVDNPDPEEYEDQQIRICPVTHQRADEINMDDCPLPLLVKRIEPPKCPQMDRKELREEIRKAAFDVGPFGIVKLGYDVAMMVVRELED